jgi:hypothetical protein
MQMTGWETWKKSFDTWENTTAKVLEGLLKSPVVLKPSGMALTTAMRLKAVSDRAVAAWWGATGLPTKRDQERAMHALNQLQSRLHDLEEKIDELKESARS